MSSAAVWIGTLRIKEKQKQNILFFYHLSANPNNSRRQFDFLCFRETEKVGLDIC